MNCGKPDTIGQAMLCPSSAAGKVGQFALVSYIPGVLAQFLDCLRLDLTPKCNPHAHVSILPPRPLVDELKDTIHLAAAHCRQVERFEIGLAELQVFPVSNVIYLGLEYGATELNSLYRMLNVGPLAHAEAFPYHPHITVAQSLAETDIDAAVAYARDEWAKYRGPRKFWVGQLSFVQQVAPDMWVDVAELALIEPVMEPVTV